MRKIEASSHTSIVASVSTLRFGRMVNIGRGSVCSRVFECMSRRANSQLMDLMLDELV